MPQENSSRREFVKRSGIALALSGFPTIVPSTVLGGSHTPPSDRITLGAIGVGEQGRTIMSLMMEHSDVQVVGICDVDRRAIEQALPLVEERYGRGTCNDYRDFRDLLSRSDIDAVTVTTPDHWHALISVAAAEAGKDVYCEKPLANTIYEGRAIVEAVKKHARVLQTGSHERSRDSVRFACELVRNGHLGTLHTIRINMPVNQPHHEKVMSFHHVPPPEPVPEGFDYDFWLGHTPQVPYCEARCPFWWRFILAYGGGEMTDRGAHIIDIAQLGAGQDEGGPVEISAIGGSSRHGIYDAFMSFRFVNTYANGVRIIGGNEEPRGLRFEGSDGSIFIHVHGGELEAQPASLLQERTEGAAVRLGRTESHYRNFLDCVKSRQEPFASAETGHRTASICHLNNIAMLTGQTLEWDPEKEMITNSSLANNLLSPTMRAPWKL